MTAMALYYDATAEYKTNLIFNFMNFNENKKNGEKKVKKLNGQTYKMTCISAIKSPKVLKMTTNCC